MILAVDAETLRQLTVDGFFRGCSYGLLGVGFALILGVTGRFHFAYGFTYTLAAYMAFTFTFRVDIPFWPGAVLGVLVAALVGASIERFVYRPLAANAGPNALLAVFVAALGLGIAGDNLVRLFWGSETQAYFGPTKKAYHVWDTVFLNFDVWQAASGIVITILLALMLRYSALGRRIKATRVNPDLARTIGIDADATYVICFFLGTICAGVAAIWYAPQVHGRSGHGLGAHHLRLRRRLPRRHGALADPGLRHRHRRGAHRAVLVDLALRAVDANGRLRRARRLPHRSRRALERVHRPVPPADHEGLTLELWLNYLDQVLIYATLALSLNLLLGYAGQVSVAHAGFGAIGGYAMGYLSLTHGWNFLLGTGVGMVLAFVIGSIVALPALKLTVEYLILLTLAVSYVILGLLIATPSMGGTFGLIGLPTANLFGWHLLEPHDWVLPSAGRDVDRVRDLPADR